jgi:Cysteine-rich CPCC
MGGGANRPSLQQAQATFAEIGAIEERFRGDVRALTGDDQRESGWRPLDVVRDKIQVPRSGVDYGQSYPSDVTTLYYWRRSVG